MNAQPNEEELGQTPEIAALFDKVRPIMEQAKCTTNPEQIHEYIRQIQDLTEPVMQQHIKSTDPQDWKRAEALQTFIDGMQDAMRYEVSHRPNVLGDF